MGRYEDMTRAELLDLLRSMARAASPDLTHELHVYQVELEMQNRDLRESQQVVEDSRSRYADLYDFAPVGYCTLDAAGELLEINLTGAAMLGGERSKLLGRPLVALVGADGVAAHEHLRRCAAGAPRVESELRLGDGPTQRVVQVVSVAHEARVGEVSYRTVLTDVTALSRAHDALRWLDEATAALSATLDEETVLSALERVAVPSLAARCVVELAGASGGGGAASSIALRGLREAMEGALARGHSNVIFDPGSGAGDPATARAAAVVPLMVRGSVLGVVVLLSAPGRRYGEADLLLAERLATRAALALEHARLYQGVRDALDVARRERARAEQAGRARDEFLATVSHELRSPLASILGWTGMLRARRLPVERRDRALATVERNAQALLGLISELLDLGRVIAGKLHIERSPVDLAALVDAALESIRPVAALRSVRVVSEPAPRDVVLDGDASRLQQVVGNLLSNALKFSEPGGVVHVAVRRSGHRAEVTVSDRGVGIAPESLPFVFDRFHQAEGGYSRAHGGLGLGLAIVRALVDAHGGEVTAESEGRGRGATFRVWLPLLDGALPTAPSRRAAPSPRRTLAGVRALVVDDDDDARELVCAMLTDVGAQVTEARSAAEAFTLLRLARPAVMVSDIGMAAEDGCALLRRVRSLSPERGGATPAVALTAYATQADRARVAEAGFAAHLTKPVDPAELADAVASALGAHGPP